MDDVACTDPSKQAIKICFPINATTKLPFVIVNDTKVQLATSQKQLGSILDSKLDFNEYIDNKINKYNYRYNEKAFFNPVKRKLAQNIRILCQT